MNLLTQLDDVKTIDAGKTDISNKAKGDVRFNLLRNTLNTDDVTGVDVGSYLDKAADINNGVDTVPFGLETDDGELVKVYVAAEQADAFEEALSQLLALEDDVEEAINQLALKFDIVDVVWPKSNGEEDSEEADEDEALDLDGAADLLGGDDESDEEVPFTMDAPVKESTMTIGSKFLERVTEAKQPVDRVKDGFDIPMDTVARSMEAYFTRALERQLLAMHVMAGATGKYLKQFDAQSTIEAAADQLRKDASVRRAFLAFYRALATAKGFSVPPSGDTVTEAKLNEAKLPRGSFLQRLFELVLVKLGMPEELILTTGPAMIGTNLYRTAKLIDSDSTLETALRNLARRLGVQATDAAGGEGGVVKEAEGDDEGLDIRARNQFATNVETILNGLGITKGMFSPQGRQQLNRVMTTPPVELTSKNSVLRRFIQSMGFTPIEAATPAASSKPTNATPTAAKGTITR